ncbi:MAG TPA: FtsX-like permease family protein [Thermoplasmata archaeon]|nr:FtsX-like permease family protein [Thermoplasmata archaeon]
MRYSVDSLTRRRGRTAATALGIGLATSLVVILLAVSEGVQTSSASLAAASGVDLLMTSANTSLSSGAFPPLTGAHTLGSQIRAVDPNVAGASPWLVSNLVFANSSLYAASNASQAGTPPPAAWAPTQSGVVGWIPDDNVGLETPAVLSGPGFATASDPHYANGSYSGPATGELVLDDGLATVLDVKPGDLVWASAQPVGGPNELPAWFASASPFRVVGISGPFWLIPSALLAFVHLSELQGLLGGNFESSDAASLMLIHLTDADSPGVDQSRLAPAFPRLTVFTVGNILGAVASAVSLYRTFGEIIGVIGVVVATLFTTTVLLMSVDDRSREIAVLRAIGYGRARIGLLVLEEGLMLSALGLAVGLVGGAGGTYFLNTLLERLVPGLPAGFSFVAFDLAVVLGGAVEVLAIGLVASILPALRAVSFPVAEELRAP